VTIKSAAIASKKKQCKVHALARAAACAVECLEPRQLLSSVVTTYPVPIPDSSYWSGYDSHIIAGPKGNFWFTDSTNNAIGEVTPNGKVTEFPLPVHNVDDGSGTLSPDDPDPTNIVVGSDGNLWFAESGVDRIGRITPSGVITEFHTPTADSNPTGMALGADGDIWFGESGTGGIGKIAPNGKITEFSLLSYTINYGDSIAEGPDGNIWFLANDSSYNGAIGSISPIGKLQFLPLDYDGSSIASADGALWVADGNSIDRVTTDGTTTNFPLPDSNYNYVGSLRVGTDGNLYFPLSGDASFGKITSAGDITEYPLPNSGTDADGNTIDIADLVQAPDGRFWFVDSYNPQVGVIDLTNALLATGASISVTAGSSQTSTAGSFVDLSGASAASDYTATLTLSDGTVINGTVAANSTGGFDVSVTNNWTIGYSNATLTITDSRDTTRVTTATTYIQATAPLAVGTGVDISAAAGQNFFGTVASFTNVDLNSLSSYSASIDWGDGHITTGTIAANTSGGVDVSGSNDYAQSGTFTVTTTLLPYATGIYYPGGPIGIVPVVQPLPMIGIGVDPIPAGPVSKLIGFASPNGTVTSGNPDSGVTGGTVIGAGGIGGISTPVSSGGNNAIRALPPIYFNGNEPASATSKAAISTGVMQGTGYSVQASSKTPFSGDVASFTLTDGSADLSHFHATVEYNDPGISNWFFQLTNAPSDGVITSDGNGGFTVSTSTQFTNSGLYHFVVKITDDRLGTGDSAVVGAAYGQVIVDTSNIWLPIFFANGANFAAIAGGAQPGTARDGAPTAPSPANPAFDEHVKITPVAIKAVADKAFSGSVGVLKGIVSGASNVAALHGTIHWGDGTTSSATFALQTKGKIAVLGSHTYAAGGKHAVSIDISQTLYNEGQASTLYPLHLPKIVTAARVVNAPHHPFITTGGIAITGSKGISFNADVASFTAPAVDPRVTRKAVIWWGDGTHSAGTVAANGTMLTVSGTHLYKRARMYKVRVEVVQSAPRGSHIHVAPVVALISTSAVVS
jgi:virginiamycin B lyase